MIMCANEDYLQWDMLKQNLEALLAAISADDFKTVRQLLRNTVSGYTPGGEIVDWLYERQRQEP